MQVKKINNKVSLIVDLLANVISTPHYCYHNDSLIAKNCLVCLVELNNSIKFVVFYYRTKNFIQQPIKNVWSFFLKPMFVQ